MGAGVPAVDLSPVTDTDRPPWAGEWPWAAFDIENADEDWEKPYG